jgi:predicted HD superfamily hydrolase involved in NAD metabolism
MKDLEQIRLELKTLLPHKRYRHTLGVEETAVKLGEQNGLDTGKLRYAALLHDIGKSVDRSEQLRYSEEHNIPLSDDDRMAPGVIHAIISEFIAKKDFGVTDPTILESIRYHTTGFQGMSLFDKVIFAADYLDPGRGFRNERQLFNLTLRDFEQGVFEIIKDKINFVIKKGDALHPLSTAFYETQRLLLGRRGEFK